MNLSLPKFCEFYKFYIVEEIALERNIDKIHYGKCNIIGYLSSSNELQSLTIPNIEKYEKFKEFMKCLRGFKSGWWEVKRGGIFVFGNHPLCHFMQKFQIKFVSKKQLVVDNYWIKDKSWYPY